MASWLSCALLSTMLWGLWGFLVKLASSGINPLQMQVLFVFGMVPLVAVILIRTRGRVETDGHGLWYGLLNGVLASLGMIAFYMAMERGKASVVGPVTALFPLVTVLGAVIVLRERINWVQGLGLIVALGSLAAFA